MIGGEHIHFIGLVMLSMTYFTAEKSANRVTARIQPIFVEIPDFKVALGPITLRPIIDNF